MLIHGKIKFYKQNEGCGMICVEGSSSDYFFNISNIQDRDEVFENEEVQFEGEFTSEGMSAKNIKGKENDK